MTLSRRKALGLITGGLILTAAGRTTQILTRSPDLAMAPWDLAGQGGDPRIRALSYALLSPNPHNRQPWRARLDGADEIALYRNPAENLPQTDPFDRQLTIGMGCFLETLHMAAAEDGFDARITLFPQGEGPDAPTAHIRLTPGGRPDPLFAQVMARRTNRAAYDDRAIAPEVMTAVLAAAQGARATRDPDQVQALRDLTVDAMQVEMLTHDTHMESMNLTRIGAKEINANPDGISLRGPMMEGLASIGMLSREQMSDPDSAGFQQTMTAVLNPMKATPAYVWLPTPGNSRRDQIAAGRTWMRLHLSATAQGLAMQPVSQALQEYDEVQPHYRAVHSLLAEGEERVQMLGRIGYGPAQPPAPRWPLETRLKNV